MGKRVKGSLVKLRGAVAPFASIQVRHCMRGVPCWRTNLSIEQTQPSDTSRLHNVRQVGKDEEEETPAKC